MENGLIMAIAYSSLGSKTRRVVTLTSGTSWTVPAGVTYVNATLIGGGGAGGSGTNVSGVMGGYGAGGQIVTTTVNTTPGASITYAIGGGASAPGANAAGGSGGTTTFTGATSALGGNGGQAPGINGAGNTGTAGLVSPNHGLGCATNSTGGAGGSGQIILEYFL